MSLGDDGHDSEYDVDWLLSHHCLDRAAAFEMKTPPRLWDAASFPWEESTVPYDAYANSSAGLRAAVASILANGFAVVSGAPPTLAGTKEVVERMSPPAATVYGEYYELTAVHNEEATDSSYSNVPLGSHTDTTYYSEAYGYCYLLITYI